MPIDLDKSFTELQTALGETPDPLDLKVKELEKGLTTSKTQAKGSWGNALLEPLRGFYHGTVGLLESVPQLAAGYLDSSPGRAVALAPDFVSNLVQGRDPFAAMAPAAVGQPTESIRGAQAPLETASKSIGKLHKYVAPVAVGEWDDVDGWGDATYFALQGLGQLGPTIAGNILAYRAMGPLGAVGFNLAANTGETYGYLKETTGDYQGNVGAVFGGLKGALDSVLGLGVSRKLLGATGKVGDEIATAIASKLGSTTLGAIVKGGVTEGATELLQQQLDEAARAWVDENYDMFNPGAISRLKTAGALGTLGGVVFGGGAHRIGKRVNPELDPAQPLADIYGIEPQGPLLLPPPPKKPSRPTAPEGQEWRYRSGDPRLLPAPEPVPPIPGQKLLPPPPIELGPPEPDLSQPVIWSPEKGAPEPATSRGSPFGSRPQLDQSGSPLTVPEQIKLAPKTDQVRPEVPSPFMRGKPQEPNQAGYGGVYESGIPTASEAVGPYSEAALTLFDPDALTEAILTGEAQQLAERPILDDPANYYELPDGLGSINIIKGGPAFSQQKATLGDATTISNVARLANKPYYGVYDETTGLTSFGTQADLDVEIASRGLQLQQVDTTIGARIDPQLITAHVKDLPNSINNPRVRLDGVPTEQLTNALTQYQRVIEARTQWQQGGFTPYAKARMDAEHAQLVQMGVKVTPTPGQGFTYIGKSDQFVALTNADVPKGRLLHATATGVTVGPGRVPVYVVGKPSIGSIVGALDLDRLAPDDVRVGIHALALQVLADEIQTSSLPLQQAIKDSVIDNIVLAPDANTAAIVKALKEASRRNQFDDTLVAELATLGLYSTADMVMGSVVVVKPNAVVKANVPGLNIESPAWATVRAPDLANSRAPKKRNAVAKAIHISPLAKANAPSLLLAEAQRLTEGIHRINRRFKLNDTPLYISLMHSTEANVTDTAGMWFADEQGNSYIQIYYDVMEEVVATGQELSYFSALLGTLTHEFGHHTAFKTYRKLPHLIQMMIEADHTRYSIASSLGGDPVQARTRSMRTLGESAPNSTDAYYYRRFDEFIADAMSGALVRDEVVQSEIEQVYKTFRAKLKMIFDAVQQYFKGQGYTEKDVAPGQFPGIDSWVRELKAGRLGGSFTQNAVSAREAETREANAKTLGISLEQAQPTSMEGEHLGSIVQRFGLQGREAKKLKANVDRFTGWSKIFLTLRQVGWRNAHIKELHNYIDLVDQFKEMRSRVSIKFDEVARDWRWHGLERNKRLSAFIFDMDGMAYRSPQEVLQKVRRKPTKDEFFALVKKHGLDNADINLYSKIGKAFGYVLDEAERIGQQDIVRNIEDPTEQQTALNKLKADYTLLRKAPYFPHMWFGRYSVIVKDAKGATVAMMTGQTKKEQQRLKVEAQKQFPGMRISDGLLKDEEMSFIGMPGPLLRMLKSKLPKLTAEQLRTLNDLEHILSPSQSFSKRLLERKNVAGFSTDTLRVFANYGTSAANHLARMEFAEELLKTVDDMDADAHASMLEGTRRQEIAAWLRGHFEYIMDPSDDYAKLRTAISLWFLGYNPKSALLNATQLAVTTGPFLHGVYGTIPATKMLARTFKDVQQWYMKENPQLPEHMIQAIEAAIQRGTLDETMAVELASLRNGSWTQNSLLDNKVGQALDFAASNSMWMFQTVEKFNRLVTFMAAYRLALQDPKNNKLDVIRETKQQEIQRVRAQHGWTEEQAVAYAAAVDAIHWTQFDYSKFNKPEFVRGGKGVLLTFQMFTQGMLFFLGNAPGAMQSFLMLAILGGAMGLPGAEDLEEMLKLVGKQMYGKDWNPERAIREYVASIVKGTPLERNGPDIFVHGLSRSSFGLGLLGEELGMPIPKFDVSGSIGMGKLLPGFSETMKALSGDSRNATEQAFKSMGGAGFGVLYAMFQFMADNGSMTEAKKWEKIVPIAAKNMMKSYRLIAEGGERDKTGATIWKLDANDPVALMEGVGQALGFTPTGLKRTYDRISMEKETIQFWDAQKLMLVKDLDEGFRRGDDKLISKVLDKIARFNQEVPYVGKAIKSADLVKSLKARDKTRARTEAGLPQNPRQNLEISDRVRALFPQ